jgi:hypothetical protein
MPSSLPASLLCFTLTGQDAHPQPPDAVDKVALRVQAKTTHEFFLIKFVLSFMN